MMLPNTHLLDAQLDLLNQQVENWERDHEIAMFCRDVEDLIALGLETLDRIRKRSVAYNQENPGNAVTAESQTLLKYWKRWHGISVRAIESVEWIEAQGHRPERAGEFRFAINEAAIAADWEKVTAARQRIDGGKVRTLQEIEDELSHQPR